MNILITCALPVEFNQGRNSLGLKEITDKKDIVRIAKRENITLVYTRIGKLNSLLAVVPYLTNESIDLVIESGTCGSLIPSLHELTIISSTSVVDFFSLNVVGQTYNSSINKHLEQKLLSTSVPRIVTASIECTITNEQEKIFLLEHNTSVVNWESSAIFSACERYNIPVVSIRVITDMCNKDTLVDFKKNKQEACKKLYNYIKNLCIGI